MNESARPIALNAAEIVRHYHVRPYATLVLSGGYEEAGDQGRFQVEAGDVLLHPAFSAHRDRVGRARTDVLDIPLPMDGRDWPGLARVKELSRIIDAAASDLRDAQGLLIEGLSPFEARQEDPADRLAQQLTSSPSTAIGAWSAEQGYAREWLSRRFRRLYGIDAALFRLEARARSAWRRIVTMDDSLAGIAAECGFADQPHMTRAIGQLTGRTPRAWRRASAVTSVQEGRHSSR